MDGFEGHRVADYFTGPNYYGLTTGPDGGPLFVELTGPALWSIMEEISFQNAVDAETRFAQEQRTLAAVATAAAIHKHEVALAGGSNG